MSAGIDATFPDGDRWIVTPDNYRYVWTGELRIISVLDALAAAYLGTPATTGAWWMGPAQGSLL